MAATTSPVRAVPDVLDLRAEIPAALAARPMAAAGALPGRLALEQACAAFGFSLGAAQLLHRRSNAVWRVGDVVVRLALDTPLRRTRADTSIAVTRWLAFTATEPIALPPVSGEQPVVVDGAVATFLPYRSTAAHPITATSEAWFDGFISSRRPRFGSHDIARCGGCVKRSTSMWHDRSRC
ncbi:hypothetical protein [Nocardia aobensis]|uniref:hypothetical protein n=1 Tax=Nocardia aobensis TaxID=257277 RepID=UPI001FE23736|nr:hypothetical protein [Nocardia aobensis]